MSTLTEIEAAVDRLSYRLLGIRFRWRKAEGVPQMAKLLALYGEFQRKF
jgi:hypothetical protein